MRRAVVFLPLLMLAQASLAEVRLASIFTDHMVLQRGVEAPIWGSAKPGEHVRITATWRGQASTTAGPDGKWMVRLKTNSAGGGPYSVTVRGENSLTLQDVMLGEVWLLSGQSNMEWSVGQVIQKAPPATQNQNQPNIRYFNVPNKRSRTPLDAVEARWVASTPEAIRGYSAIGFFFAQEIQSELKVPVGLIQSDWGGTEVEVWIREGALRELPGLSQRIDEVLAAAQAVKVFDPAAWRIKITELEKGLGVWEKPDFNDSTWKAIEGPKPWDAEGLGSFDGYAWYRAKFELSQAEAGQPLILELGAIDDEDVTFVNGVKVGENTVWNLKRRYEIPASALRAGQNVLAVRVLDTQQGGGFTNPGEIRLTAGVRPVSLTGWRFMRSAGTIEVPRPADTRWPAGDLYNGMIAPIVPFAIKGALWYQGESNVGRAFQYRATFPLMIENWRKDWSQGDFPFYFAQIAPFNGYGGSGVSAELREAQLMTLKLKNTGLVVTTDVTDDLNDIHPGNKWDVGHRFALLALNRAYGKKRVDSGPIYKSYKVEGDKVRITFEPRTDDLVMDAFSLPGLTIAGEDKRFVMARARIEGKTLVVYSDEVRRPVAVRYGWADSPKPGLLNTAKLPASPFRTDDWPGLTVKNKW
jgi:sialate O-acetylesterase